VEAFLSAPACCSCSTLCTVVVVFLLAAMRMFVRRRFQAGIRDARSAPASG
jgi:hypothetical protein